MPKITLKYESKDAIPAGLQSIAKDDNTVEVYYNTDEIALAAELNPTLEKSRNTVLDEKKALQGKYDTQVQANAALATENGELKTKIATTTGVSVDDLAIVQAVKSVNPELKADDVKTRLTEHATFKETIEKTEATKTGDAIFAASGLKSRPVFDTVWNNKDHNPNFDSIVWKDETVNGEAKKVPYVKVKAAVEGKNELTVAEYTQKTPEWTPFMASLNAGDENRTWLQQDRTTSTATQQQQHQTSGGAKPNISLGAVVTAMNKEAENRPNPLNPTPTIQAGQQSGAKAA